MEAAKPMAQMGKYHLIRRLGRGGMAEVYLGTHLNLERLVAIKLLHSYIEEEPTLLERFHREAKAVAGLRHSNIVQIFDFDSIDGHPYIVMEYLKGPTLANYLRGLHDQRKIWGIAGLVGPLLGGAIVHYLNRRHPDKCLDAPGAHRQYDLRLQFH